MTFLALAAFASAVARASEPVVDCVEVKTRSADNPLVKVWYRVPRDYDPSGKGRMRTLILFGGRNCDGKAEVSGKLGWTEWADLNGIFLVAPTLDFGDRPRMTPMNIGANTSREECTASWAQPFRAGAHVELSETARAGPRRGRRTQARRGAASRGEAARRVRRSRPPGPALPRSAPYADRRTLTRTPRRPGRDAAEEHTHADGADEENMAGALSSQTLQHYQV